MDNWNGIEFADEQKLADEKEKHTKELIEIRRLAEEDKKREIRQMKNQAFWGLVTLIAISWVGWYLYRHDRRVMTSLTDITARLTL